ncbi:MAG: sulfotransferase-like domain-containing protein [Chthoniobacterales bacterium]
MERETPIRIAIWSGPRNISTAMLRAWENRPDTFVVDEPFYAFYLQRTGIDHPGREEVIAQGETDWRKIANRLTSGELPNGARIFYQKQMTHHLLPDVDRGFVSGLTNCFLIRHPAEVIASYVKKREEPALQDLGFEQQAEIFDWVGAQTGKVPPVIDARDVLENPRRTLTLLCDAIGVEFSDSMLSWPPGRRATDGVWAKHWYSEVEKSNSFQKPPPRKVEVPEQFRSILECGLEIYERLHEHRLH